MTTAGDQLVAGRIPGERIATSIETSDSATFSGTETVVQSVTAALVTGRTYRVTFDSAFQFTADGGLRLECREDNLTGTSIQLRDVNAEAAAGFTVQMAHLEVEFTAISTGDKTFVVTGRVTSGGGDATRRGGASFPSYLYVEYISG